MCEYWKIVNWLVTDHIVPPCPISDYFLLMGHPVVFISFTSTMLIWQRALGVIHLIFNKSSQ